MKYAEQEHMKIFQMQKKTGIYLFVIQQYYVICCTFPLYLNFQNSVFSFFHTAFAEVFLEVKVCLCRRKSYSNILQASQPFLSFDVLDRRNFFHAFVCSSWKIFFKLLNALPLNYKVCYVMLMYAYLY